jgi:hypothetical protein
VLGPICERAHSAASGELQKAATEAAADGDLEELREVRRQLQALVRQLHDAFRKTFVSPKVGGGCLDNALET